MSAAVPGGPVRREALPRQIIAPAARCVSSIARAGLRLLGLVIIFVVVSSGERGNPIC